MTDDRLKVVEIGTPNLKDVPNSLRRLADQMDSGEVEPAEHCLVVATGPSNELEIYGYGAMGDKAHEVGVLYMAAAWLAAN